MTVREVGSLHLRATIVSHRWAQHQNTKRPEMLRFGNHLSTWP